MKVNVNAGAVLRTCAILLTVVIAWCFSDLLFYVFLAFIFALIGKPIAGKISNVKIFKHHIPYVVSSLLTMVIFVIFFSLTLLILIPTLIREARVIAGINYDDLAINLNYLLNNVQDFLYGNNLIDEQETLVGIITSEIKKLANFTAFSNVLGGVVSTTGSFFFGLFAVFFLTFFFIKDNIRLENFAQLFFSKKYVNRINIVSEKINNLLSRYFIGLLIEIASMIILLYIGLAIFGIKGALLLAFLGGMLNAIPYLGPLIGTICACLFGAADCISVNDYDTIFPTVLKIAGTFIGANLIDNLVLQPLIYSQSVKAHPIEIFLVIIMGGTLAGIAGMLFAIPVYTIIRTIVVEIFRYVNNTENDAV